MLSAERSRLTATGSGVTTGVGSGAGVGAVVSGVVTGVVSGVVTGAVTGVVVGAEAGFSATGAVVEEGLLTVEQADKKKTARERSMVIRIRSFLIHILYREKRERTCADQLSNS